MPNSRSAKPSAATSGVIHTADQRISVPTGTVPFLFTDIEGSTDLVQQYPDAMPPLLARHHAILHQAMEAHHGFVFQIVGDAFSVAFPTPLDVLKAAVDAQRGLHAEAWTPAVIKVRMGIHIGAAQAGANDDRSGGYVGYETLSRAQRVMSAAHGGQVLLSGASAELVRSQLPAGVTLRDMGEHRLKGFLQPEHLWQVVVPDLPQVFPRLHTLSEIPSAAPPLPELLTRFIGRTDELRELERLLPMTRLLTLTGAGGTGKTRLALELAALALHHQVDAYTDGVWLAELATLSDPSALPQTLITLLGLREEANRPALATLIEWLRDKHLLLILDNCEHLIEACAHLVEAALRRCAQVRILATSREVLGIAGELVWRVPSLQTPDSTALLGMPKLKDYEAVRLFVDRATLASSNFELNAANAAAVQSICVRLDGIPLALELAAAQLKVMSAEEIAARLNDRLRLLKGGSRTALPRQQTLRATIAWSYQLLTEPERRLLQWLSVFVGGWTLEAAEQVCQDDSIIAEDVLGLLTRLLDKSLVMTGGTRVSGTRWTMLEMIREFALDALAQSSDDELDPARQRHAEYFARLLKRKSDETYPVIDVEQHNARAALHWLLAHKHPLTGELAQSMGRYFEGAGLTKESRRTLPKVLSADIEIAPAIRCSLLGLAVNDAWRQHDFDEGLRCSHEALAIARAINAQTLIADRLIGLGHLYIEMDDGTQAKQIVLEALQIGRTIQHITSITGALAILGEAELILGNEAEASAYFEEAHTICRNQHFGKHVYAALACIGMGKIALNRRDYASALQFLQEGWEHAKPPEIKSWILDVLAGVIGTMPRRTTADVQRAAKIWSAVEVLKEKMGLVHPLSDRRRTEVLIAEARSRIDSQTFAAAWAEGRELSLDEAVVLATERLSE